MDFNFDTSTISSVLELDPGTSSLTILGTSGAVLPAGTTAQRAATTGVIRFNTELNQFEGYTNSAWTPFQSSNTNLAALSGLNGTGFITQTGPGTFEERWVTGTTDRTVVTNGGGLTGNVVIDLATAGTVGTYVTATTDAYGRVVSGTTTQAWSTLTGTPTTLAGYGITDSVVIGNGVISMSAGTLAARPTVGTAGRFYFATDTNETYYDNGTTWILEQPALTGDISVAAGTTTSTLATVNSNVGSFGSATAVPVLTVDAKGRITAVSTATISSAIDLAGDITGSGATGSTITTTLATVNSNVGTFGDSNHVAQVTVNAKGLVTGVANVAVTPASIGAIATTELGANNGVATLDATGKLTISQIPAALVGALIYVGVWDASTNTPTITSGIGVKGQYYTVGVAGTTLVDGINTWQVGDLVIFNGTTWDGIDGIATEVTSVFGRIGAVTATLASADFANQGTTTTVLHGNAAGNPTWGAIDLTTDVTGTLPTTTFPALTGDVTTVAGFVATTLATVNGNVGTFGSTTTVPVVTVNAKGLVTEVTTATIPNTVALTGDGTASVTTGGSGALTLATVNSNVGSFGSSTSVPVVTVNAKGLVTAVSTATISGAISVTGGDLTMSGSTGSDITNATLATVNSNVGTFGNITHVAQVTVNAKGLVTGVSNVAITAAGAGAVANEGGAPSIQEGTAASIPAATVTGAIYITTDTNQIFRANGTTWDQIGEAGLLYTESVSSPVASTVTGANAVSIGSGNTANSTDSFATGSGASTSVYGAEVRANGSFTAAGDAQTGKYVLRNITSNATQTEVFLDGSAARIVLPNNSAMTYSVLVSAHRTDATGSNGAWKIEGLIKRDANAASTALVGNRSKAVLTRPNSNWDVEVYADATNGALTFRVTGQSAQTIRWVVAVTTSEVSS